MLRSAQPFGVTYRVSHLGPVTIGDVIYGADVRLDFDELNTGYLVNIPMRGLVESRHRGRQLPTAPDMAAVFQPSGETVFTRWPAHSHVLAVKVDRKAVERLLDTRMRRGPAPVRGHGFRAGIDLATGAGRSWSGLMLSAIEQLAAADSLLYNPLVAAPFTESVVNGFLLAAHTGYASALTASANSAPSSTVRKAVDLIEADPAFPWTPETLAERCFARPRTLQNGFRRHLGTTPMEYVRTTRLRQARQELREASVHETTVASVAYRWGFGHLGRFAAAYKKVYGEPPGRTLRG